MEQTQKLLSILFGISASFYMMASIILFVHCFYDAGIQWNKKKAIILVVFTIIEAIVNLLWYDSIIASIPILIGYMIIPVYDCQGKKFRSSMLFIRVYFTASICLVLVGLMGMYCILPNNDFESTELTVTENLLMNILVTLFFGVVFHYLHRRIFKQGVFILCGRREKIFGTVYTILSFVLYVVIIGSGKQGRATMIIMACCVILFAAMFPIFIYYTKISEYYRERTKYQETYLQAELAYFQQYKQAQEETRRFRHDIKNNLLCMNEMLRLGRTEDATEYLQGLIDTAETLSAKYVSGDEILDCILAAKASDMERKSIVFKLDGVLAGGLSWKPIDVCNVFANALDNAIEACENMPTEQRIITMKLKATQQFWFIRIQNPVARDVDVSRLFQEKSGYTSKSNSLQHGIGTYNMKRNVERYGGIVKAECKDNQFILEFMIDKSSFD